MEKMLIDQDIKVVCVTADSFPEGIMGAHKKLHSIIPFSTDRRYYGMSRPENGNIIYKAAAEKLEADEGSKFTLEELIIQKGEYMGITILNYQTDSRMIGKAFEDLIKLPNIDPNGYCIEWYVNDKDVKCLIRLHDSKKQIISFSFIQQKENKRLITTIASLNY